MAKQIIKMENATMLLIDEWLKSFRSNKSFYDILEEIGVLAGKKGNWTLTLIDSDGQVRKFKLSNKTTQDEHQLELGLGSITRDATVKTTKSSNGTVESSNYKCDKDSHVKLTNTNATNGNTKVNLSVDFGTGRDELNAEAKDNCESMKVVFQYPSLGYRTKSHCVDIETAKKVMNNFQTYSSTIDFFENLIKFSLDVSIVKMPRIIVQRETNRKKTDLIESIHGQPGEFMITEPPLSTIIFKDNTWRVIKTSNHGIETVNKNADGFITYNLSTTEDSITRYEKPAEAFDGHDLRTTKELIKRRNDLFERVRK